MAAAVSLRLQGDAEVALAGQVLIYPGLDGDAWDRGSRKKFDGIVITRASGELAWEWYSGGRDISHDPFAAPLYAPTLAGLPPALVILGGCDVLLDDGRAYAARLRDEGIAVEEVCYPGQPHGFVNFGLPAAEEAYKKIGTWTHERFGSVTG
jgi:acetyl esterase